MIKLNPLASFVVLVSLGFILIGMFTNNSTMMLAGFGCIPVVIILFLTGCAGETTAQKPPGVFDAIPEKYRPAANPGVKKTFTVVFVISGLFFTLIAVGAMLLVPYMAANQEKERQRMIDQMPTTSIASVKPGIVKIRGVVQSPSPCPIEGGQCGYYELYVEYFYCPRLGTGCEWIPFHKDIPLQVFYLKDATGTMAVNMGLRTPQMDGNHEIIYGQDEVPANVKALLDEKGWLKDFYTGKKRVKEDTIREGDELTIIGTAVDDHGRNVIESGARSDLLFIVNQKP